MPWKTAVMTPCLLLLLALFAVLPGCFSMNVVSDGADAQLMLRGNDPVAYQTLGKAVAGDPQIRAQHDGITYRFISTAHRDLFPCSATALCAGVRRFLRQWRAVCAESEHRRQYVQGR